MGFWPGTRKFIDRFIDAFVRHDVMTLAAALSFYTALSLAPLLLITLAVVGWMGFDMRSGLMGEIENLMGSEAAAAVRAVANNAEARPDVGTLAGILGVATLLFSASSVFAQLQASLNLIWRSSLVPTGDWRAWLKKRLLSMGMVFTLAFLGTVSLLVSAALSFFFRDGAALWQVMNFLVSVAMFGAVFASLFKYLPDARLPWRCALPGGAVTALLFSVGKHLIGLYLGQSAVGSAYGAAGSLVVLLVWVYYSSVILFVGAEFTRALSRVCGEESK